MMRAIVIAVWLWVFSGGPAISQPAPCAPPDYFTVHNGFADGRALVNMSDSALTYYVMGFVDSLMASQRVGVSAACTARLNACVVGRSNDQLRAMTRKHLQDNPANWHLNGSLLVFSRPLKNQPRRG